MTEDTQTYSEYVNNVSSMRVTMLSLLAGFSFTTITILLSELPDLGSVLSSFVLLFLTVIFDLLLFLLGWQVYIIIGLYRVREFPPHSRWELSAFNGVLLLVFYMWGASPALIYLVKNLSTLALVSGGVWAALIGVSLFIGKHMTQRLGWSVRDEWKKLQRKT
jgi:hypothetical protein